MTLFEAQICKPCIIRSVRIPKFSAKIRLMELGVFDGQRITVFRKSLFKKTFLVSFGQAIFTLNAEIAREIEVIYE